MDASIVRHYNNDNARLPFANSRVLAAKRQGKWTRLDLCLNTYYVRDIEGRLPPDVED
jgi:hypothetical protein